MKSLILALGLAVIPAGAAEVGGVWHLVGHVADVNIDRVCTIKQAAGKIQGPCKNQMGETVLSGEVNGKNVTWKYEAKYEGATVVLLFKGALESDAGMTGSITASDTAGNNMTTGTFTA